MSYWSVPLSPIWTAVIFYTRKLFPDQTFIKDYVWREKWGKIFLKKEKWNVLKVHSAKKLLTLSKSQFLLLPGCIKCRFTVLLQSPSQALAMPTARRTEGMRHSVPQVINPSQHPARTSSQLDFTQEVVIVLESAGPFLSSKRRTPDLKHSIQNIQPIPGLGRTSSRHLHVTHLPQYLFS